MIRLGSIFMLWLLASGCFVTIGDPLSVPFEWWWVSHDTVDGDCPTFPELDQPVWGVEVDAEQTDRRRFVAGLDVFSSASAVTCVDGEEACQPVVWDDGTQVVHATLVGATGAKGFDAVLELVGTCGPYCGEPTEEPSLYTCSGSTVVTFERLVGGIVYAARPDEESCALISEPFGERGEATRVWLLNGSSSRLLVMWHAPEGPQQLLDLVGGSAGWLDTFVGDRFEIRDIEGTCLRAFDVTPDLERVVVKAKGGEP
jgi:hypothetical protein